MNPFAFARIGHKEVDMRFTVLASGSSGNACLVESHGVAFLIDAGLGPRQLQTRLDAAGCRWQRLRGVVLTHLHCDHCNERTLLWMLDRQIRLYCHVEHGRMLQYTSEAFNRLYWAGLVCEYEWEPFSLCGGMRCTAVPLRHDRFTCGFRFEGPADLFGSAAALGYACDLGCWDNDVAVGLRDVDILALEFNHDVHLQKNSGRPRSLIRRVLGADGHLSNEQAADLLGEVLRLSEPGRLRHLVQLHLSGECNRPDLALQAAQNAVASFHPVQIHAARADRVGPQLSLNITPRRRRVQTLAIRQTPQFYQPFFDYAESQADAVAC
jgi:phosphoribosyl 1,2-cyclic phosphodiesterase